MMEETKTPPGTAVTEREATAKIVARWLDELIRIPGTNFRIGLDPIVAFVPGIGDFLASSVSLVTIIESVRTGVAPSVVGRMGLNMFANALLGIIPVVGPAFSAFFKSNTRNLQLLRRWQEGDAHEVRKGSRWLMGIMVGLAFVLFASVMIGWSFLFWSLWKSVRGG